MLDIAQYFSAFRIQGQLLASESFLIDLSGVFSISSLCFDHNSSVSCSAVPRITSALSQVQAWLSRGFQQNITTNPGSARDFKVYVYRKYLACYKFRAEALLISYLLLHIARARMAGKCSSLGRLSTFQCEASLDILQRPHA